VFADSGREKKKFFYLKKSKMAVKTVFFPDYHLSGMDKISPALAREALSLFFPSEKSDPGP
jgi:hypothetical protein